MRSTRLFTCLLGLSALVALNACQDHRLSAVPPGSIANRLRVKSLTEETPNSVMPKITQFTYDTQGRLSSGLNYYSPDSAAYPVERSTYQYNAQNRLGLYQRQVVTRPGNILGPFSEQEQFNYNTAGQLIEIRYSYNGASSTQTKVDLATLNDPSTLRSVISFRYNAANQLIGSTKSNYFAGQVSIQDVSDYSYTGDNVTFANVVTTFYSFPGGPTTSRQQISMGYDTKVNPFYGVYVIPTYFGVITPVFPNLTTLSRNNINVVGGITYRYEYNTADLPTVRYTMGDKLTQTLRFQYESY